MIALSSRARVAAANTTPLPRRIRDQWQPRSLLSISSTGSVSFVRDYKVATLAGNRDDRRAPSSRDINQFRGKQMAKRRT